MVILKTKDKLLNKNVTKTAGVDVFAPCLQTWFEKFRRKKLMIIKIVNGKPMRLRCRKLIFLFIMSFISFNSCKQKAAAPAVFQLLDSAQTHVVFKNTLSDEDAPGILNYLYFL